MSNIIIHYNVFDKLKILIVEWFQSIYALMMIIKN